jgi:flagellar protein FliO/FliZ
VLVFDLVMTTKFFLAIVVFCAGFGLLHSQTGGAAPDESALLLDSPPPAQVGVGDGALRENEQNFPLSDASLQGGVTVWGVMRVFLALALVALAIYGIVFFLKKGGRKDVADDRYLKILAAAPINARTAAAVVSVGAKAWLVGVSDSAVSLVSEIDDREMVDAMLLDYSQRAASMGAGAFPNFLAVLRRVFPAGGKSGADAGSGVPGNLNGNLRKNRDRLKGL